MLSVSSIGNRLLNTETTGLPAYNHYNLFLRGLICSYVITSELGLQQQATKLCYSIVAKFQRNVKQMVTRTRRLGLCVLENYRITILLIPLTVSYFRYLSTFIE